jgi:hypothetical protein
VAKGDGVLEVTRPDDERDSRALHGLTRTLVTTATTDDEGRVLCRLLGFPFKEN